MCLSHRVQDAFVSLRASLWESLPLTFEVRTQGIIDVQKVKFNHQAAGEVKLLQLNEPQEWCYQAYKNAKIYK